MRIALSTDVRAATISTTASLLNTSDLLSEPQPLEVSRVRVESRMLSPVQPTTQNIEALFTLRQSYYRYDRPKTNVDIGFQYYASLNNWGRQRMQLDTGIKREVLKDLFIAVNVFDTFDSRPPTAGAAKNDVGVALSFGWSY